MLVANFIIWEPILRPRPPGTPQECRSCGYCLKGLEEVEQPRCPECGAQISREWLTSPLCLVHPSRTLKACSLVLALCTWLATGASITGFFFAAGGKRHWEWRGFVGPCALTSVGFALVGLLLAAGMIVFSPLSRRYLSTRLNLGLCLLCFGLIGCCTPMSWT
jgi:hypothetical protein